MKLRSILSLLITLGLCAGAAQAKGGKKGNKNRDTDGNGTISLAEFTAGSKKPEKAKARFEKADANHNGELDKTEAATLKKGGKKGHGTGKKKGGKKKHKKNG